MNIYPYSSPIILTDNIFVAYGGHTGTSTANQRTACYFIAEQDTWVDLNTFLLPTIVTGTFDYSEVYPHLILDYTFVHDIKIVRFLNEKGEVYWSKVGTNNTYFSLKDDERGIIDLHYLFGNCACQSHSNPFPYWVQVAYTAGLPTGTSTRPDFLLAMTKYSDVILNEIIGYGNEAPGDMGVQSFRNQEYSEVRKTLLRTTYGTSAMAQFIAKHLRKYKRRRHVGLGV